MADPLTPIRRLGRATTERIWRLGFAARFLFAVLRYSGASFRRLPLTLREIYFSGVMSLIIILVSGLFVGLVLALFGLVPRLVLLAWALVSWALFAMIFGTLLDLPEWAMKRCSATVRPRRSASLSRCR